MGYVRRVAALVHATVMFPRVIFKFANRMLKEDGFSFLGARQAQRQGPALAVQTRWLPVAHPQALRPVFKPGYHPWQETDQPGYDEWLAGFNLHRNPVEASELMRAAMLR